MKLSTAAGLSVLTACAPATVSAPIPTNSKPVTVVAENPISASRTPPELTDEGVLAEAQRMFDEILRSCETTAACTGAAVNDLPDGVGIVLDHKGGTGPGPIDLPSFSACSHTNTSIPQTNGGTGNLERIGDFSGGVRGGGGQNYEAELRTRRDGGRGDTKETTLITPYGNRITVVEGQKYDKTEKKMVGTCAVDVDTREYRVPMRPAGFRSVCNWVARAFGDLRAKFAELKAKVGGSGKKN